MCTNIHNIFDAVRHYLPSTFTNTKCTYIHIYMTVYATNRSQNIGTYYNIPFPTLPHSMRLSRHIPNRIIRSFGLIFTCPLLST